MESFIYQYGEDKQIKAVTLSPAEYVRLKIAAKEKEKLPQWLLEAANRQTKMNHAQTRQPVSKGPASINDVIGEPEKPKYTDSKTAWTGETKRKTTDTGFVDVDQVLQRDKPIHDGESTICSELTHKRRQYDKNMKKFKKTRSQHQE